MTTLQAYIDGLVDSMRSIRNGGRRPFRLSNLGSLGVAMGEGDYTELARAGKLFICAPGVITNHVAAVTDVPTTASAYSLYNPANSGVKLLVMEIFAVLSGTSGVGGALLYCNPQPEATAVTANSTGVVVKNMTNPDQAFPGFWATGVTLDVAAAWAVAGATPHAAVKSGIHSPMPRGGVIVKPGSVFGTHYYTDTGTSPKAGIGCIVAAVDIDTDI